MSTASPKTRRYAGKTRPERLAERRARLLDAGLELFGTLGYGQTTIEMICEWARLNPRYFYEQFASREELLGAVYDRHIASVTAAVAAALADAPLDPLARLRSGLRAFLDSVLADPRGARINYFEIVGVSAELEQKRRGILSDYADMVTAQIAEITKTHRVPLTDHRLAAVAMVGATDGLIIYALAKPRRPSRQAIIGTLTELVDAILSR